MRLFVFCLEVISLDNTRIPALRDQTKQLPQEPGVYIMRDAAGKIIYIGKAKSLRNRVGSYFRSVDKHHPKVYKMVQRVENFDYILTGSEFEALVLEASMIKQHKPQYNILLKDDKGYHYIRISNELYPRIAAVLQKPEDDARYIGPYLSSFVINQTVDEVQRAFRLPTCRRKFPDEFGKGRPCLNYHIKQCAGVCIGRISQAEYAETIQQCLDFIAGGSQKSIESLTMRMEEAADSLEFEKAAGLRDKIRAIQRISERQNVVFNRAENQDVIALAQNGSECCAAVLKFREQRLVDKLDFMLGEIESLTTARRDFLMSYYGGGAEIPKQISIDCTCEDQDLVARYLSEKAGRQIVVHVPERGERLKLVEMARSNASQILSHKFERTGKELAALDELTRLLGLESTPDYIEAYDVSNMGEETVVGGMVVFENGRPLKSAYKKFNIKTVKGTDDYASMREVISRRLARYEQEKDGGTGFGRLPDLILLDGGRGHVNAVAPLIAESGLTIPLYGMVKDTRHRTRAIATDGGEISITSTRSAYTLLSQIQDEVHRFSITHMKSKHTKNAFTSSLTSVPGIGEIRTRALLRYFKTQKSLRAASVERIMQAPGMNRPAAENLYAYFHPEKVAEEPRETRNFASDDTP